VGFKSEAVDKPLFHTTLAGRAQNYARCARQRRTPRAEGEERSEPARAKDLPCIVTISAWAILSIKLDAGSALLYLEEKAKGFFGKDFASLEAAAWLSGLQNTAVTQTRSVQCVGMHKPVPFDDIYQPTMLVIKGVRPDPPGNPCL
jgi:hypothetical protein